MKPTRGIWSPVFTAVLVAITAAACSGGSVRGTSLLPTGPSGSASGGAQIAGRVTGLAVAGSSAVSAFNGATGSVSPLASLTTTSLRVTIAGTSISTSVDGAGQFTLDGVPPGTVVITFTGPGVNASVTISGVRDGDRIEIEVRVDGSGARIESERHGRRDHREVELEGRITAVSAADRTIRVNGMQVHVPESARIRRGSHGLTFADLVVGAFVEIHGALDGTIVRATEVKLEDEDDDEDNDEDEDEDEDDDEFEMKGAVSALDGTCPAVSFRIGDRLVRTSRETTFKDMTCSRLRNTLRVEVRGRRTADGVLLATRVEIDD